MDIFFVHSLAERHLGFFRVNFTFKPVTDPSLLSITSTTILSHLDYGCSLLTAFLLHCCHSIICSPHNLKGSFGNQILLFQIRKLLTYPNSFPSQTQPHPIHPYAHTLHWTHNLLVHMLVPFCTTRPLYSPFL